MDTASKIVSMMSGPQKEPEVNPAHELAKSMLSHIRTGNAEGFSQALEDHYQMVQDKILNASSQESAGDEANKVSTE